MNISIQLTRTWGLRYPWVQDSKWVYPSLFHTFMKVQILEGNIDILFVTDPFVKHQIRIVIGDFTVFHIDNHIVLDYIYDNIACIYIYIYRKHTYSWYMLILLDISRCWQWTHQEDVATPGYLEVPQSRSGHTCALYNNRCPLRLGKSSSELRWTHHLSISFVKSVLQPHRSIYSNLLKNHMDLPRKNDKKWRCPKKWGYCRYDLVPNGQMEIFWYQW